MKIHFFTAPFFSVNHCILPMMKKKEEADAGSGVYSCCGHAKKHAPFEACFLFANIIRPFR